MILVCSVVSVASLGLPFIIFDILAPQQIRPFDISVCAFSGSVG